MNIFQQFTYFVRGNTKYSVARCGVFEMKITARITTGFIFLVILDAVNGGAFSAPELYSDWGGRYSYREDEGSASADASMSVEYTLRISHGKKDSCALTAIGYQSNEHIICSIDGNGQQIEVKFISYTNGKIVNKYDVAQYKPNQILFELKRSGTGLVTTWRAFATNMEQGQNMSSSYFKKMK